jgi:ATP-dependent RNA helicase RhlE
MRNTQQKTAGQHKKRPSKPRRQGGGRKKSTLNPNLFIKPAQITEQREYVSKRTISDLPIHAGLKQCLLHKGFKRPTEIQDQTLEHLLKGRDLLGIAQTGTGKTAAFLVPIIHQLLQNNQKPYALVVVPTRELALQVEEEFRSMTKGLKLYSHCFIGGTNIKKDEQALRRSSHVVIGTPGRLLDLMSRRMLDLRKFNTLVLDEYDRMLDMGFVKDVNRIIDAMHQRKHTLLFSATLDKTQKRLINEILTNPVTVQVSSGEASSDNVAQDIIKVAEGEDKFMLLKNLLADDTFKKVLVFEETKHRVKRLCQKLNRNGLKASDIHGDKSQNQRQHALSAFKAGKVHVLVATDVAARGLDVSDISHVVNYQVPQTYDTYIHRIGRTGRAGKTGFAFTFVD